MLILPFGTMILRRWRSGEGVQTPTGAPRQHLKGAGLGARRGNKALLCSSAFAASDFDDEFQKMKGGRARF